MSRSLAIYTYTQHSELFGLSSGLLSPDYDAIPLSAWEPSYPYALFRRASADWYIHLDEDVFVFRKAALKTTIDFMEQHGYVCCGMPDGGAVSIRRHNPVVCNPFFLIVHKRALMDTYERDPRVMESVWNPEYQRCTPSFVLNSGLPFAYDNFEEYYPFFYWLLKTKLPILYLKAEQWRDEPEGISTMLYDPEGEPFALHTWHSRHYRVTRLRYEWMGRLPCGWRWAPKVVTDGPHRNRIDRALRFALSAANAPCIA